MSKEERWDFFARIERLEKAATAFAGTQTTAAENKVIAFYAFALAFLAITEHRPDFARRYKDLLMPQFKAGGLGQEALNVLDQLMVTICDFLE